MKSDLRLQASLLPLVGLAFALSGCAAAVAPATTQSSQPTTVIVVRHAERAPVEGTDPPLSAAGSERAEHLADAVDELGIDAIYTTQRQRTRLTAEPAATRLGIPLEVLPMADAESHARAQAAVIRAKHRGGTVLVVGHSNTVPLIVRALGGPQVEPIADTEFDQLHVLIIPPAGTVRALQARYGPPNPPS